MIRVIHRNLNVVGLASQAEVIQGDVRRVVPFLHGQGEVFHIVFVDPPYGHGLVPVSLDILSTYKLLHQDGIIVSRHERRQEMSGVFGDLELTRQERYGDTVVSFYMFKR